MTKIGIAYEPHVVVSAELLAQSLCNDKNSVAMRCVNKFPIADSMFPFLLQLSSAFETAYIVISDSPESSGWISKELHVQHSIGNFTNLRPAFLTAKHIPMWWQASDPARYILVDHI